MFFFRITAFRFFKYFCYFIKKRIKRFAFCSLLKIISRYTARIFYCIRRKKCKTRIHRQLSLHKFFVLYCRGSLLYSTIAIIRFPHKIKELLFFYVKKNIITKISIVRCICRSLVFRMIRCISFEFCKCHFNLRKCFYRRTVISIFVLPVNIV